MLQKNQAEDSLTCDFIVLVFNSIVLLCGDSPAVHFESTLRFQVV